MFFFSTYWDHPIHAHPAQPHCYASFRKLAGHKLEQRKNQAAGINEAKPQSMKPKRKKITKIFSQYKQAFIWHTLNSLFYCKYCNNTNHHCTGQNEYYHRIIKALVKTKTIFALSTARGKAALALIRISGPHSYDLIKKISTNMPKTPNMATLNEIKTEKEMTIDQKSKEIKNLKKIY